MCSIIGFVLRNLVTCHVHRGRQLSLFLRPLFFSPLFFIMPANLSSLSISLSLFFIVHDRSHTNDGPVEVKLVAYSTHYIHSTPNENCQLFHRLRLPVNIELGTLPSSSTPFTSCPGPCVSICVCVSVCVYLAMCACVCVCAYA